mgnify:CR=1 FL=1
MAFSACVDPLKILVQTCPKVSTKTELRDTPVKLVMLMLRVHTTGPYPIKVSKERHMCQSFFSFKGEVRKSQMARLKILGSQLHKLVSNETKQD